MRQRRDMAIHFLLTLAMIVVMALYLRAAWDVAFAGSCAEHIAEQLKWHASNTAEQGQCPALDNLTTGGQPILSSQNKLVFLSHGLLCSVRRIEGRVTWRVEIEIGRPVLSAWTVAMDRDECVRVRMRQLPGGVLRSLTQERSYP